VKHVVGGPGAPAGLRAVMVVVITAGLSPSALAGQGFRGWAGTTVQAVEMRPVTASEVGCISVVPCYLPLAEQLAVAATQDVSLTAWRFGVRGLSATTFLRARTGLGSATIWPRARDRFDVLLGYAQLVRGPWTARVGRQETRSGLGFSSFDGASARWRRGRVALEAFGGRSLARGLRDPVNEALKGIERFVPDQGVYLWGGSARGRFRTASLTARYQREILADRSGLASERAALDGSVALPDVRFTGAIDYDLGIGRVGKGHVSASVPIASGRWMVSATARRYVPYFSLSTIWGFFEPVSYHEAQLRLGWSHSTALAVWLAGGWRRYGDTETAIVLRPLEDIGWRSEAGTVWRISSFWSAQAGYRMEWGPGGFLSSGDAVLRWSRSDRLSLSLSAMSFQQIEQYRLGDGRALGGGFSVDADVTDRLAFQGGVSVLRHRGGADRLGSPWNQGRAWSSLRVQLGRDPGLANRSGR